jgi:hypothetical protein
MQTQQSLLVQVAVAVLVELLYQQSLVLLLGLGQRQPQSVAVQESTLETTWLLRRIQ